MSALELFLVAACIVLVLLPPKWDPAIRLKEWNEREPTWADESRAMHWINRYAVGLDAEPQMDRILECVAAAPAPTRIDGHNGEELTIEWPGRLRLSIDDKGVGYALMRTPGKWTAGKFDADTQQSQAAEEMRRALAGEKP